MSKTAPLTLALLGSLCALPSARADDEPAIEGDEAALPYLKAVHAKVHPLWADNFLRLAASQLPKDHAINTPSRKVELDVVIAAKGALADVRVAKPSGSTEFDSSAIETVRAATELPPAPEVVLSDDGKVHLRWVLARDDRRCSGLSLAHHELPLVEAVRSLTSQGRALLAVARVRAADDSERVAGMDAFARAWLDHWQEDAELPVLVALANAIAGDQRGAEELRQPIAHATVPTVDQEWAARGLAALKIPICPLIEAALAKPPTGSSLSPAEMAERRQTALAKLAGRQAQDVLRLLRDGADGACLAFALTTANDRAASKNDRLAALACLGHSDAPEVKAALRALVKDPDPAVAARAILAEARPGAGRGAVFRLTPLLRDKSAAVREAAAAALVRVGGEEVLPQLFQIHKEKAPGIFLAVAAELANLSGPASAELLGRLLKRDNAEVRVAAARALAARRDEHAVKLQATLATADSPELQLLSGLALAREKREAAVRAQAGESFAPSYSALLRGNARVVAADWLLAQFAATKPQALLLYMGEWLATRPQPM